PAGALGRRRGGGRLRLRRAGAGDAVRPARAGRLRRLRDPAVGGVGRAVRDHRSRTLVAGARGSSHGPAAAGQQPGGAAGRTLPWSGGAVGGRAGAPARGARAWAGQPGPRVRTVGVLLAAGARRAARGAPGTPAGRLAAL